MVEVRVIFWVVVEGFDGFGSGVRVGLDVGSGGFIFEEGLGFGIIFWVRLICMIIVWVEMGQLEVEVDRLLFWVDRDLIHRLVFLDLRLVFIF